jgi:hypothetical protein
VANNVIKVKDALLKQQFIHRALSGNGGLSSCTHDEMERFISYLDDLDPLETTPQVSNDSLPAPRLITPPYEGPSQGSTTVHSKVCMCVCMYVCLYMILCVFGLSRLGCPAILLYTHIRTP